MAQPHGMKRKHDKPNLFETRDLIKLVKDRSCLWDRNDQDYRDKSMKESAWLEIYRTIEPDFDHFNEDMKNLIGAQITRKWYNVRDSYAKSKKQVQRPGVRHKPYIYAKLLTFLDPVYFGDKDTTAETSESGHQQWLNEVLIVDEENEPERPKLTFENTDTEENLVNILTNIINREEDDDRAFFKSIIPAVKKLSDDSRMEFRVQVMNLLQTLKNRDRNDLLLKKEIEHMESGSD